MYSIDEIVNKIKGSYSKYFDKNNDGDENK
jgi:hypothetical protein